MTDEEIGKIIHERPSLSRPVDTLQSYEARTKGPLPKAHWNKLRSLKRKAVAKGNQPEAKAIWCIERIGRIQDRFISAYDYMRSRQFYEGWCDLERCEIEMDSLESHFKENSDEFGLEHIRIHVKRFQELFPYQWFMSPSMLIWESRCSICNTQWRLRSGCEHMKGEIYHGEMCSRIISKVDLIEISLVTDPSQKYSVVFLQGMDYDYSVVQYVVDGLRSPWVKWDYQKIDDPKHHPVFRDVADDEQCPCNSGLLYKDCCMMKEKVFPHWEIKFSENPLSSLPTLVVKPPRTTW